MNKTSEIGITEKPAGLGFPSVLKAAVRGLSPAYFAMAMATGIVSLAAQAMGLPRLSVGLFWLNIVVYLVLWVLSALRAVWFTRQMFDDMLDHRRGPGFFTLVAGTCVLGSQFVVSGQDLPAFTLWIIGGVLWVGLTYAVFTAFIVKASKPSLDQGISGTWLLFVVAPQSLAVLGALLAGHGEQPHRLEFDFVALSLWLCGGMLYAWLMGLIFYRVAFFKLSAAELAPSHWISMGAMAISTLAGALLILDAPGVALLQSLLPFLKGLTLLYWAIGTWWIPVLVVLGVWRHVYKRVPLRYDPAYWSIVFPLGMYAAGTFQMERALDLPFLMWIPQSFLFIATLAWLIAFGGLLYTLAFQFFALSRK